MVQDQLIYAGVFADSWRGMNPNIIFIPHSAGISADFSIEKALTFIRMIRILPIAMILMSVVTVKAQSPLSYGSMNGMQPGFRSFDQRIDTSHIQKKWFITKYAGISAGFMGFNGTNSSFLSAPLGVQINRQLTNNVSAFAGVSSGAFIFPLINAPYHTGINKNNHFMNPNRFGTYTTAQMGVMYINNERTFSISGSIGVSRDDFYNRLPMHAPVNAPVIRNYKQ